MQVVRGDQALDEKIVKSDDELKRMGVFVWPVAELNVAPARSREEFIVFYII